MPLYEYECDSCHHRFERIQKFSDAPVATCPDCGGPVRKLVSSPAIQFKGSGWYITDYARQGTDKKTEKTETTEKTEKTEKTDTTGAEKPAGEKPAKTEAAKSSTSESSALPAAKPSGATTPAKS
jgi:putative FmdB family regulatory protein